MNEIELLTEDEKIIYEGIKIEIVNETYIINYKGFTASIEVRGKERYIPHFHIFFKSKGKEREACFCIFEAKYANHESYHVKLTGPHLKILNAFLMHPLDERTRDQNGKIINYWKTIVNDWASIYADSKSWDHWDDYWIMEKPDYSNTTENKQFGDKYNHSKAKEY